jgi:hypothetical protein
MRGQRTRPSTLVGTWFGVGFQDTVIGAFESIATARVGATSQTTILFDNIPQKYKHLQLRVIGRSTGPYTYSSLYVRPNGDTGLNYTFHALTGDGSSASSSGRGTGSDTVWSAQNISGANATANNFGVVIIDILDYTDTNKRKTMRSFGGYDNNGSGTPIGTANNNSSVWLNSSAITYLNLFTDGDFAQYTHAALYGIEG